MRLFRFGFTHIGLCLFNQLLTEVNQLQTLCGYFTSQSKVEQKRVDQIDQAIDFFLNQNAVVLGKELLLARATDAQTFIRKSVYENIADLGPAELKIACQLKDVKLIT